MSKAWLHRWWPGLVVSAAFLGLAFFFDNDVQDWCLRSASSSGLLLANRISFWGDWPSHVIAGVLGFFVARFVGSRRWSAIFAAAFIACILACAVNPAIKFATGRSRPLVKVDAGWNGPRLGAKYHSYPSGHTFFSAAFIVAVIFGRPRIGFFLWPIPIIIGWSRVYLNAHYFSDAVAGAIFGVYCAIAAWHFVEKLAAKKGFAVIRG